jgi:hypothetical protein
MWSLDNDLDSSEDDSINDNAIGAVVDTPAINKSDTVLPGFDVFSSVKKPTFLNKSDEFIPELRPESHLRTYVPPMYYLYMYSECYIYHRDMKIAVKQPTLIKKTCDVDITLIEDNKNSDVHYILKYLFVMK